MLYIEFSGFAAAQRCLSVWMTLIIFGNPLLFANSRFKVSRIIELTTTLTLSFRLASSLKASIPVGKKLNRACPSF